MNQLRALSTEAAMVHRRPAVNEFTTSRCTMRRHRRSLAMATGGSSHGRRKTGSPYERPGLLDR
ncbi:hypothetical protein SAMN04489729_2948 [Amycolatopsis lurida]|uniref:Uncharacterized protein n=1 Tax=Amycolatopsis lurida NRRL 2430 TaxID=1460371 RepID=A0A2P2FR66_AMYLU|nr:hypothetical protein BB31_21425 [Amycolatopsis lurida NRRL 2430]SEC96858.1 hypothetical protein SAMN04489729_2948 [Amycolatopsis lurida]